MKHDKYCTFRPQVIGFGGTEGDSTPYQSPLPCICDIINSVRADERTKAAEERALNFGVWHDYEPGMP